MASGILAPRAWRARRLDHIRPRRVSGAFGLPGAFVIVGAMMNRRRLRDARTENFGNTG